MAEFKGVSEKFAVMLVTEDCGSERIRCEIGLEGLVICTPEGRTVRKYPLSHISRWALRGTNLVLYTKTPNDVEEHTVTLQGEQHTMQSVLDTLTCSCMQMVELLQSKETSQANTEVTNSLTTLLNGGSTSKTSQLTTVEEVEYWKNPEKTGWMHSQGEYLKSWRRRWFVLKDGFLFRFASPEVASSTKPRGVVDLSKVTNVSEAREQTGRPNSLKLSTESGHVGYICDSETELVEWFSALEGAVNKIVKKVAGFEDEPVAQTATATKSQPDWSRQLEKGFSSASSGLSHRPSARDSNPMVKIVGYDVPSSQPSRQQYRQPQPQQSFSSAHSHQGEYGGNLDYSQISGIAGVANEPAALGNASSTFSDSFAKSEYPAYPVLKPSRSGEYSQGYEPVHGHSQSGSYGVAAMQPGYHSQIAPQQHSITPQQQQPAFARGGYEQPAYGQYDGSAPSYQSVPKDNGPWQIHYTQEGRPYYHNSATGSTQWDPPASMA